MKSNTRFTALLISFTLLLSACASQQPAATQSPSEEPTEASAPVVPTEDSAPVVPTEEPTDVPKPVFIPGLVTTTENNGGGSLRQTIAAAKPGDVITFDPNVFPVDDPAVIHVSSPGTMGFLRGGVTVDASNAGVILDGEGGPEVGFYIGTSDNKIYGIKFENFSLSGILVSGENWDSPSDMAANNIIGGDPTVGDGPYGQGNCFVNNGTGLFVQLGADKNIVSGNFIGVEADGSPAGNPNGGVVIQAGADDNVIGPNNIIANTDDFAIKIEGSDRNIITQNSIYNYGTEPVVLVNGGNKELNPNLDPETIHIDCSTGYIKADFYPAEVRTLEFFSGDGSGPKIFEDSMDLTSLSDDDGHIVFTYEKGEAFQGSELYIMGHSVEGYSSTFTNALACASDEFELLDIDDWLTNWHEIWAEDALAMEENEGGQFGPGSTKLYNEDEDVFEFSAIPGESMFVKLNTPLNEFCESDCLDGYAFLIEFKLLDHIYMNLGVAGSPDTNDFGPGWEGSYQPEIYWIPEAYREPLEGELEVDPDAWYTAMIAIKSDGEYRTLVWQTDNPENIATYVDSFENHENSETYMNQSWVFKMYGVDSGKVLKVKNYKVYTFEEFKQ